jgi:hypothetical protein
MADRLPPIGNADFWWTRYGLGLAAPVILMAASLYSLISLHSYAIWGLRYSIRFVPVEGEQAVQMGAAYFGFALMLFAQCYAQHHDRLFYGYEWILALGCFLAGGGVLWCSWIFLVR